MNAGNRSREFSRADVRHFCSGKSAMATDQQLAHPDLLAALDAPDWSVALQAVDVADKRVGNSVVGHGKLEEIVAKLDVIQHHTMCEVRRAVANVASHAPRPVFENVLAKLALDDNSRVRQAAEHAALRRRDSRHAGTLG